jgi:hypothetical protein
MTRRRSFGCLVAGLMLMAACTSHRVRPGAEADLRWAYLYMKSGSQQDPRRRTVKFVLRCMNGNSYVLGSTGTRDIQVLQIVPTTCWFVEAVYRDIATRSVQRVAIEPPQKRPLDFQAGRAHYLGDFFGNDRYESTTAAMKQAYPNLARVPTVEMRLLPTVEQKRTNGVALAPGEPPLSPERVAGIAPFIKRNYASPGECEAACPTGQCLPYRGESGPLIACVTLCDTDKDCPEGLACNCPTSDGGPNTACRRIATLPQDPMARICLSVEAGGQRR